jgi:hypothetical protein
MPVQLRVARVVEVLESRRGRALLGVEVEGERSEAIAYPSLTGPVEVGDEVVLNVTAVALGLGTGGRHFVIGRLGGAAAEAERGHVMKLRYTPLQFGVLSIEEEDSPHHEAMAACASLDGMPVVACSLHSMIGPAAGGVKAAWGEARVAYLMTDGAALPLALSDLAARLRETGLIAATITCGQAFGGDHEAVNLHSGLLAARCVVRADVAIVAQGPGNVGTRTDWGTSAIEQGEIVNAAGILGGRPVAAPRIGFADPRARHRGLSRHAAIALGQVAVLPADVVVPRMAPDRHAEVMRALEREGIASRHRVVIEDGGPGIALLQARAVEISSMGRSFDENPEYFLAASAAGAHAGRLALGE